MWTALEASGQSDLEEAGGLVCSITLFPRRERWRSELGLSLRQGGCSLQSDLSVEGGGYLALTSTLNGGFWTQRQGWGLACWALWEAGRPEPLWSSSPKAVYTQGWECLFFLVDFLQINPWPAERGSQQQLFTQCL